MSTYPCGEPIPRFSYVRYPIQTTYLVDVCAQEALVLSRRSRDPGIEHVFRAASLYGPKVYSPPVFLTVHTPNFKKRLPFALYTTTSRRRARRIFHASCREPLMLLCRRHGRDSSCTACMAILSCAKRGKMGKTEQCAACCATHVLSLGRRMAVNNKGSLA